MLSGNDVAYHQQRAQAELDQAKRAKTRGATEAHVNLARLHMERIKRQDELYGGAR